MKPKKLSRFLSAVLALALVAGLMPAAFAAEGEDIIEQTKLTLEIGDTETLVTTSDEVSIEWSSDHEDIAAVDDSGTVTPNRKAPPSSPPRQAIASIPVRSLWRNPQTRKSLASRSPLTRWT